jgi:two-component system sensor histidine kinase ChiS
MHILISYVVNEVVNLSLHLIGRKDLQIINEVEKLPIMNLDEARIQQVLQNIIGNAVKFTQKGKVVISSELSADWVRLSVSDIQFLLQNIS